MKNLAITFLGFMTVAALGFLAYQRFPTEKIVANKVMRYVSETRTRTEKQTVKVNGQDVEVTVEVPYTVNAPAWETRQLVIQPTSLQKLQFWLLVGTAVLFFAYMVVVLVLWARDKMQRKRDSSDTRDTQKRVDGIVTFCTGIFVGFLGNFDFSDQSDSPDNFGAAEAVPVAEQLDDSFDIPPSPAPLVPLPDELRPEHETLKQPSL